jgi:ADP-heptose:LPS heptosyltransferase
LAAGERRYGGERTTLEEEIAINTSALPKILVIRFSSIGDIVLTTPVVRCLNEQVKDCEVHYLTKEQFLPLLQHNPYIKKVHTIKKEVEEVIDTLRAEHFDAVIDLHRNLRSASVKMKLHVPSRSFNKLNLKKWLAVNLKWKVLPEVHIVDRYLDTVKPLGVVNDHKGLDHFIGKADEVNRSELPEGHRSGYVAFAIGAQHATKRLPTEKIIAICKKLDRPVVLLGGKEDHERAEEIRTAVGGAVYNACGKYSINQSASLVKQAQWVITHDTGLMHIAASYKKKIFSVWGNTIPAFGMYPYLPGEGSKIIEVKELYCRPCSKLGYDKCPQGHFRCMREIGEDLFIE